MMFALNLVGMGLACLRLRQRDPQHRQVLAILLLASLCLALGLFWLAPLPWQRYVIPLAPLTCLWTAYAVSSFGKRIHHDLRQR